MEQRARDWKTHHVATIRKVRNRLSISRTVALARHRRRECEDLPLGASRSGGVRSGRRPLEGTRRLSRARRLQLREHLDVATSASHVVVFVDELNKTPERRRDTYVKKMLLDLPNGVGIWGSCCLARSSSGRRSTGGSLATREPHFTVAWMPTSWQRPATRF